MNVLLISPYFSPAVGGVETHLDDLCKYFEKKKINVDVRTYKAFGVPSRGDFNERHGSVRIHRLWWPDFGLIFMLEKFEILKFAYIFTGLFVDCFIFMCGNHKRIQTIQVHGFIAAVIGLIIAKIFRKRLVVNTHVGFKFGNGGLMDKVLSKVLLGADQILVLTNNAKQELINIGVSESKIKIYHYWVDQYNFKRISGAKTRLGWQGKFVVLFVGRLIAVKGIDTVLKLAKSMPRVTFAVAGSGPESERIKNEALNLKNLVYLGKVKNFELKNYYSAADVLIVPSLIVKQTYEEGIPRVMIEALSCSLPVISTKSGGIPDVFNKNIGFLVEDSFKEISSALQLFVKKPLLLQKMRIYCRYYAVKVFSSKNAEVIFNSLS